MAQQDQLTWQPLASSNVDAAAYDANSQTLYIRFIGGGEYTYYGVPQATYDGLLQTGSPGRYVNQFIKGVYAYDR